MGSKCSPHPPGSALLLTLWCVGILGLAVVAAVKLVEFDLDEARMDSKRAEARQLALTGIALASHPLVKPGDPLLNQRPWPGGAISVRVESEDGRVNLNRELEEPSAPILRALFEYWGLRDREISVVVDSLIDWVDEDDLRSLNGAEREDLLDQSRYSLPQNTPFVTLREAERVRGMALVAAVNPNWMQSFSVFSGEKIDIHEASLDALIVLGGLPPVVAGQWIEARDGLDKVSGTEDDIQLSSLEDLRAVLGLGETLIAGLAEFFDVESELDRITSTGTVGGVSYTIVVVARHAGSGEAPEFFSWEEL